MRIGRLHWNQEIEIEIGLIVDQNVFRLSDLDPDLPTDMIDLLRNWQQCKELIGENDGTHSKETLPKKFLDLDSISIDQARFCAPIDRPGKVICVGRNYAAHAAEMGSAAGEFPVIFNKFPTSVIGPDEVIRLPKISQQVDFEAELVVVIGKPGSRIPIEDAGDHIFGYCCGNDITARDWQKGRPGGQWLLGKTCDTFAPTGPYLVTSDSIGDPTNLAIRLRLNGEQMQIANTGQLIFPVHFLISHLSQFCRLEPGDLIFTGTPSGVGAGRDPQIFLKDGDQLEVEIQNIGILRNSVSC